MTDDVLFRYFSTLADASPIPLLIYNAPGFCGVTVSPALAGRLAGHPGIVGMKDSASSGIEQFLEFESDSFHVLAGSANFLFPAMMNGSVGGTVSLANSFPSIVMELFRYGQARDEARGVPLQARVTRINKTISGPYGPSGVKAAMNLGGFKGGIPRRPLLPLTAAQVEEMRAGSCRGGASAVKGDILSVDVGTTTLSWASSAPRLRRRPKPPAPTTFMCMPAAAPISSRKNGGRPCASAATSFAISCHRSR